MKKTLRVAVGSDHGGFRLKGELIAFLKEQGFPYQDFGTYSEEGCDYPDVAAVVARAVARGDFDCGVLICGTGIGMSIVANKVRGVRAALCHDTYSARMSREHNQANVLTLGQRVVGTGLALEIVSVWLATPFSNEERHLRRVGKIRELDEALRAREEDGGPPVVG